MAGVKSSDISGTMFVVCWDEDHVVSWDNWVSETQHMIGISGAKLKFEFHVIDRLLAVRTGEERGLSQGVKKAKDWMKGMWCGEAKRRDSAVVVDENVVGFELMDDFVRSYAIVPDPRA